MSQDNDVDAIAIAPAAAAAAATAAATAAIATAVVAATPEIVSPLAADKDVHILGVIGGSSLFHAKEFSAALEEKTIETEFGGVVVHVGMWKDSNMQVVFIQRHHADPDLQYKQPRQINFKAIATALKQLNCDAVIGVYSVGSMNRTLHVGRFVVPEDYFNPFDILHMSRHYDAHIVPDVTTELRAELVKILDEGKFNPHDGGVYVQTAGPRFETKAEVRFFSQFGDLIGMTGANEAELLNELRVPFAMFGLIDNMANGMGEKLTLEDFKATQKLNAERMEGAIVLVLNELAEKKFLATLLVTVETVEASRREAQLLLPRLLPHSIPSFTDQLNTEVARNHGPKMTKLGANRPATALFFPHSPATTKMETTTSQTEATTAAASDVAFMRLAIAEAHKSIPSENAFCVGCVIVRDGAVLSTGFSRELPGNTHAEQVALDKLNFDAEGATVYTTMEPCSTRVSGNVPCVQSCLRAKVGRVVVGVMEPKNFVVCEGVRLLQDAGVQVELLQGLEDECLAPNRHLNLVF